MNNKFVAILKESNRLTNKQIVDIILSSSTVSEAMGSDKIVYRKNDTTQFVSISGHADEDRDHRRWWTSYKDPNFTNFVDLALRILQSMFKRKLEIDAGVKKKSENPHLNGVEFREFEEFGIVNKERTLGMAISLRKSEGRYCTSFCIITILNMNSADMNQSKDIFSKGFKDVNHTKTLENFKLVTESIGERKIHILEI
jgi:hypothetical protein